MNAAWAVPWMILFLFMVAIVLDHAILVGRVKRLEREIRNLNPGWNGK